MGGLTNLVGAGGAVGSAMKWQMGDQPLQSAPSVTRTCQSTICPLARLDEGSEYCAVEPEARLSTSNCAPILFFADQEVVQRALRREGGGPVPVLPRLLRPSQPLQEVGPP